MLTRLFPYFEHPLVLVGAVLFTVFGIFRLLLNSGILLPPARKEVAPILHKMLNFGFTLAFIATLSGFGLEYWKTYKQIDRIKQAKQSIAAEILINISSLDERLGYFKDSLEPDTFHQHLNEVRKKVAPGLRSQFARGYDRVLIEQKISTLRQLLNSSPLRTRAGYSEFENLHQSGVDTKKYHTFYNQLSEVERVSEDFFTTLAYVASMSASPSDLQAKYNNKRLELAVRNLDIESQIAYIFALQVLREVSKAPHPIPPPEAVASTLQTLNYLRPREMPTPKDEDMLLAVLMERKSTLVEEKTSLTTTASQLNQEKLDQFEQVNQLLKINSTDTWNQVVGKAVSLRQLGRTAEAVAAFSRYAEMFAATDPTAKKYSHIAQQFTLHIDLLDGQEGGVYILEVKSDSIAQQAGLEVGDIITAYNSQKTTGMDNFVAAVRSARGADEIQITWLRLTAQNQFKQYSKTVPAGSIGVRAMPI